MVAEALDTAETALRRFGQTLPETREDFPWGHCALKVRDKVFAFVSLEDGQLRLSIKLPGSSEVAMHLPFAAPTGHGLGSASWITARFGAGDEIPMGLLEAWIVESYRAVAPPALVRRLPEGVGRAELRVVGVRKGTG